tara:strand:+ start:150836 stop:154567 length:3732 start_codon:yes stop_codon:yes gene_type:complete
MQIKPLVIATSLALGSCPLSALAAEEETRNEYGDYYGAHLDMTGGYYSGAQGVGQADFFIPLLQNRNQLFFTDLRANKGNASIAEGNFGLGYRQMNEAETYMWGAYGYYDLRNSQYNNQFQQVTLGGEFKTEAWTTVVNGYIPVGQTKQHVTSLNTSTLAASNITPDALNVFYKVGEEYAMGGGDLLLGRTIPGARGLTAYAGYYYFGRQGIAPVTGPRALAEYSLADALDTNALWGYLSDVTFQAGYQYDEPRGNNWYGGVRARFALVKPTKLTGLAKRMTDYVRRDVDIVTETNAKKPLQELMNDNGKPVTIRVADTADELATSVGNDDFSVVFVNGDITVDQGLVLADGQRLTGDNNYTFTANGETITTQIKPDATGSITGAMVDNGNGGLIQVGKDNQIDHLSLNVVDGSGVKAIKNDYTNPALGGSGVGTLTVNKLTTNGGVALLFNDAAASSTVNLTNSTVSVSAAGDNAVEFSVLGSNALTVGQFNNNTLTATGAEASALQNIAAGDSSSIVYAGGVFNSIFNATQYGIYNGANGSDSHILFDNINNTSIIGTFSNNTMTTTSNGKEITDAAFGVYNHAQGTGASVNYNGTVSNNVISTAGDFSHAWFNRTSGAESEVSFTGAFGSFANNTFSTNGVGAGALINFSEGEDSAIRYLVSVADNNFSTDGDAAFAYINSASGDGSSISYTDAFSDNIITTAGMESDAMVNDASGNESVISFTSANGVAFYNNNLTTTGEGANGLVNTAEGDDSSVSYNGSLNDNVIATDYRGILNEANGSGSEVNFAGVSDNAITTTGTGPEDVDSAFGIDNAANGDNASITYTGDFTGNTIITTGEYSSGINNVIGANDSAINYEAAFTNNTITTSGSEADAIYNSLSGENAVLVFDGAFSGNTLTTNADSSDGIENNVSGDGASITYGDVFYNNTITTVGDSAYGIYNDVQASDASLTFAGDFTANTITTAGEGAVGLDNGISNGSNGNIGYNGTFASNVISTTGDNAMGIHNDMSADASASAINYVGAVSDNQVTTEGETAQGIYNDINADSGQLNYQAAFSDNAVTTSGTGSAGITNSAVGNASSINYGGTFTGNTVDAAQNGIDNTASGDSSSITYGGAYTDNNVTANASGYGLSNNATGEASSITYTDSFDNNTISASSYYGVLNVAGNNSNITFAQSITNTTIASDYYGIYNYADTGTTIDYNINDGSDRPAVIARLDTDNTINVANPNNKVVISGMGTVK